MCGPLVNSGVEGVIVSSYRGRFLPIVAGLFFLAGCGGSHTEPPPPAPAAAASRAASGPSQILITIDAFAGRRVVPYGGTIAMPRLGELVALGTTYDDTISTTTLARPALVTILTGVSPDRSGVRDNLHDALPADLKPLAERAKGAGFETAAFVSTPFASYSSGLQRGFDIFDGPEPVTIGPAQHVPKVVAATLLGTHFKEWLASRSTDRPYFAWIHLSDLNGMSVPLPLKKKQLGAMVPSDFAGYDASLATIDEAVGAIVDAVRADARSQRVEWTVVGTHGTYLGESGRFGDPFWLAQETLAVPLTRINEHPEQPTGARHEARPTWLPDVAASLAQAMGVALDGKSDGVPLGVAPPQGRARLAWGYALDDQLGWPPETAVREGNGFAVFATAADGALNARGPVVATAKAAAAARPALPRRRVLPAEARAAVSRAGVTLGTSSAPVIPKAIDSWLRDLQLVRRYDGGDRPGLAARQSKILFEAAPDALASLVTRIFFFAFQPSKEASALQAKILAHFPERSDALHWAAHVSLSDKHYEAAEALLDAAMAAGPVEPEMYYDLACVRALREDPKGALVQLDHALGAGYRNWDWIDKDPDLSSVRSDPGFPALLRTHGR